MLRGHALHNPCRRGCLDDCKGKAFNEPPHTELCLCGCTRLQNSSNYNDRRPDAKGASTAEVIGEVASEKSAYDLSGADDGSV